jgi:Zn-dependent metalloprotease
MATKKAAAQSKARAAHTARSRDMVSGAGARDNGLRTFSLHAMDESGAGMLAALRAERPTRAAFALPETGAAEKLDPETAAEQYLAQALESDHVPTFTVPKLDGTSSEFKSLGVETLPLTNTRTVKFRQTYNKIPVYGSLVTIELDEKNACLAINSALGEPSGVNPVAKVSPAEVLKTAAAAAGYGKQMPSTTPRLFYYFDTKTRRWRLVYMIEDVPVRKAGKRSMKNPAPVVMDYVIDAHSGKLVAEKPRTPSLAQVLVKDELNEDRTINYFDNGGKKVLRDDSLNIQTYDFGFRDPENQERQLPGAHVTDPPGWSKAAISAHANASSVAAFLRSVLRRNNIDNRGGAMMSSVNCLVKVESPGQKQWFNAFWNSRQMVYGQVLKDGALRSLAADLDVVGHEIFHGVTENTARLEYAGETGALNESYSDIFGVLISNATQLSIDKWRWEVGEGLSDAGAAFRDMSNPGRFGQPSHMKNFKTLPNTRDGDYGGVHVNSGIHNFAAYKIMTAKGDDSKYLFTPQESAALFYLALTQQLSRTSTFSDSRRGVLLAARTLFRNDPAAALRVAGIEQGFGAAGIV